MSRNDLLGRIANARAQMMMRGHRRMKLELGDTTLAELGNGLQTVLDWPEVTGVVIPPDIEGFMLRAIH